MKRFPALGLIAALGAFAIGCEGQTSKTTGHKTETTVTESQDGKMTGETTTTVETTRETTPVTPSGGGTTTKTTTETTKETTR